MKRIGFVYLMAMALSLFVNHSATAGAAKEKGKGRASGQPSDADMMKAFEQMSAPTKEHKKLEARAGSWELTSKMAMGPGSPGETSMGKATVKSIFDGRFIVEDLQGSMMGRPFLGHGITGYDKLRKRYTMVWIDNMCKAALSVAGQFDTSGKVLTLTGVTDEPMSGTKDMPIKLVYRIESAKKHTFEMWQKPKGSKEFNKGVEVTYMRK